jgi:hypothetical protein
MLKNYEHGAVKNFEVMSGNVNVPESVIVKIMHQNG